MALEDLTGTKYIDDLNSSNPAAGDNVSQGDDHIRGIKNVLKTTFPSIDGAITATDTELNYVDGVTSNVQTQFNAITADDWVTSARIADGAVDTARLGADAVTGAKIADNAINSEHYTDGSIDTAHIGNDQVTQSKIGDTAVGTAQLVDANVTTGKLANDAVTGAKIADNAIDSEHYADGSIDNAHIANDAINGAKLVDNAINSEHYTDDSIDNAHLSESLGDLRKGVTHIGRDSNDFINLDTTIIGFHLDGAEDMRLTNAGVLHVENDVIAFSTTISDERLKHDIQPITDALSKVSQLNGVTFTYNKDDKKSAGLIAQDVEKVMPSAVSETELPLQHDDGIAYKTVQYDQTIGLLVEAIKELTAKVEKLEKK